MDSLDLSVLGTSARRSGPANFVGDHPDKHRYGESIDIVLTLYRQQPSVSRRRLKTPSLWDYESVPPRELINGPRPVTGSTVPLMANACLERKYPHPRCWLDPIEHPTLIIFKLQAPGSPRIAPLPMCARTLCCWVKAVLLSHSPSRLRPSLKTLFARTPARDKSMKLEAVFGGSVQQDAAGARLALHQLCDYSSVRW